MCGGILTYALKDLWPLFKVEVRKDVFLVVILLRRTPLLGDLGVLGLQNPVGHFGS